MATVPAPAEPRPLRWSAAERTALALILLVVGALQVLSYPGRFSPDPTMLGPQENVRLELARQWVGSGRPAREVVVPPGTPADVVPALTPRDAAVQDGVVVPKDFPGAVALTALLSLPGPRVALALSWCAGLALLAVVAALARRLGGPWSGVRAAGLLATTAGFAAGTGGLLATGAPAALAVVTGVLLLLPHPDGGSSGRAARGRDVLAGLAMGAALALRHDLVLLVAGVVAAVILPIRHGARRAVPIALGTAVAVAPCLLYYAWLHGSPGTTGYAVGARALPVADQRFLDTVGVDPEMLLAHVRHYVLRPEVGCLAAATLLAARWAAGAPTRRLALGVLLGGVPYLVFVGARPLYGVDGFTVGASLLRYALPVLALAACVAAAAPVAGPPVARRAGAAALAAAAVVGASVVVGGPGGLLDQRAHVQQSTALRAGVLAVVGPDAVVVTARGDKLLWPDRTTVVAAYLVRDTGEGVRVGSTMYDLVPSPERLADVVARMAPLRPVYLLEDALPPDRDGLDVALEGAGLRREGTAVPGLQRVTAVAPRGS